MNSSWFKQVWRLALTAITVLIFFFMAIPALYRLTKTVHYQDVRTLSRIFYLPSFIAAIVVAFGYLVSHYL